MGGGVREGVVNSDETLFGDLCFRLDVKSNIVKKRQRYPDGLGGFHIFTLSYSIVGNGLDVAARDSPEEWNTELAVRFEIEGQGTASIVLELREAGTRPHGETLQQLLYL